MDQYYTFWDQRGNVMFRRFFSSVRTNSVYKHIDWKGFTEERKSKWLEGYARLYEASTYLLMANSTSNLLEKLNCCIEGLKILPNNPALLNLKSRTEKELSSFLAGQSGK